MDYSSASEGEIVETKATTTRNRGVEQRINGHDRPRSLKSGSSRPPQSDNDSDGLDYDDHNTSSENRRQNVSHGVSSGVKRRYPEDDRSEHSDPRRFKVHYEEGQSRRDGQGHKSGLDDHRDSDAYSRNHRDRHDGRAQGLGYKDSHRYESRAVSSKERVKLDAPFDLAARSKSAEHDRSSRGRDDRLNHTDQPASFAKKHGSHRSHNKNHVEAPSPPEEAEPTPVLDEAALIEERRKRREALRAKHNRDPPLVQKVLQANASTTAQIPDPPGGIISAAKDTVATTSSTPASSNAVSPQSSGPSTPQPDSPGSPFDIAVLDDAELANRRMSQASEARIEDGPSAADYDPSMDMQEDHIHRNAVSDAADQPIRPVKVDDVVPFSKKERKDEETGFDMFADEVEIESPEAVMRPEDDGIQAVSGLKGKQLDQSMLDDWDDAEGYYRIILGELLDKRYQVQSNLGKGVFSAVVRATDNRTGNTVAIKVIRKQESMYRAGLKEIHTLEKLAEADPEDKRHVIRLERHFMHKGHLCMVFENLSINLREVLKKFGRDVGINIKAVRAYAHQIFLGLSLMKRCEVIHADLKPDNVLVNENRSQLKIADLGSAFDAQDSEVTDTLVSRFYRAPEIMLGLKGDYALDMWSIGCTLFELYTGRICFTGGSNNQMLKAIMECRGKIPNRVLKRAEYWDQHFEMDGTFLSQEYDAVTRKDVIRRMNIVRTVPTKEIRARVFASAQNLTIADTKELNLFSDLLEKCLAVDPARRIAPNDALRHGFINRAAVPAVTATKAK